MTWTIEFHPEFVPEFDDYSVRVQAEILKLATALETTGPRLGRPHADTLSGSKLKNLKELRFKEGRSEWRVAYIFDPSRKGILLCGGSKSGMSQVLFYDTLIATAEKRYGTHLKGYK
ncbi:hypothetical protein QOZ96_003317 [Brevundimonas nasdae]|uniref:type II toxin-antitoxin system RelE/ParE family toxin n=1 Tax=Brevundimonas nasdae TaxID=172043 RepID=UPI00191147FA|nr:type II toxin-antitoxin system RelE/ParE family toxin [Brevundimonas nasdae]MBK6026933.1 type II toxin-antitoxin system RelE/ParE family toxin [Brevundimonas nasdae]MDQ0453347.1 hypothetical protein [Brevundimonas nasdae]